MRIHSEYLAAGPQPCSHGTRNLGSNRPPPLARSAGVTHTEEELALGDARTNGGIRCLLGPRSCNTSASGPPCSLRRGWEAPARRTRAATTAVAAPIAASVA